MIELIVEWLQCSPWIVSAVIAAAGLVLYHKYHQTYSYWTSRGLKQWRPFPFIGTNWVMMRYSLADSLLEGYRIFGKIYGAYNGKTPVLVISDPDLVRAVCVKDFDHFSDRTPFPFHEKLVDTFMFFTNGPDWKRMRSVISPTFSSGKMKRMFPIMDECAQDLLKHISELIDSSGGKSKDFIVRELFGSFSMQVIARCAFAIRLKMGSDDPFLQHAQTFFTPEMKRMAANMLLPAAVCRWLGLEMIPRQDVSFFVGVTKQVLDERRRSDSRSSKHSSRYQLDYVDLLLEAAERKSKLDDKHETSHVTETAEERQAYERAVRGTSGGSGLYLDDYEITAQACMFLIAGYEATSMVLSLAAYALAHNPDIQERLYEVLKNLQDEQHDQLSYDTIFQQPYLTAVLNETMRLHMFGGMLERRVTSDQYRLPEPYKHVTLAKGDSVMISLQAMHLNPEYWSEPHRFDPDRFMPDNEHLIKPYSFLPFGAGPRNCVAMRLALLELKLALARVVLRYRFCLSPNTVSGPLRYKRMSVVPKLEEDIVLRIEER